MCRTCKENAGLAIVVLDYRTGEIVYAGRDENAAAESLEPGHCFARSYYQAFARSDAQKMAAKMREAAA